MSRPFIGDIACPSCETANSKVIETAGNRDHSLIRRRRECIDCGCRFTTQECAKAGIVSRQQVRALRSQLTALARQIVELSQEIDA
jgi:transcriptional regulator NrdR family protein